MAASIRVSPLADVVQRSLDDRLAALSRALLDEALRVADVRRVILTAPGVLNGHALGDASRSAGAHVHARRIDLAVGSAAAGV